MPTFMTLQAKSPEPAVTTPVTSVSVAAGKVTVTGYSPSGSIPVRAMTGVSATEEATGGNR